MEIPWNAVDLKVEYCQPLSTSYPGHCTRLNHFKKIVDVNLPFRFLSAPYSFLRNSAFYPHLRNPRFILICGIRVLSSFAESAFYPHLRNPRFILICGIRFRNPLPPFRSAFRIPFPRFIPTRHPAYRDEVRNEFRVLPFNLTLFT